MITPSAENDVRSEPQPATEPTFSTTAKVGVVLALIAVVVGWINAYAIPLAARAMSTDVALNPLNVYIFSIVATSIVVLLNIVALVLGIIAARHKVRPLMAGATIALSGTGLLGIVLSAVVNIAFPALIA